MNKKSKHQSGLSGFKQIEQKPIHAFNIEEKQTIIEEYLLTGCSKQSIWSKYTGQVDERGRLLRWMRELGYADTGKSVPLALSKAEDVTMKKQADSAKNEQTGSQDVELTRLKMRITQLEKELEFAQIKATAFSMMVDIAEKEFNLPIRKKYTTKP